MGDLLGDPRPAPPAEEGAADEGGAAAAAAATPAAGLGGMFAGGSDAALGISMDGADSGADTMETELLAIVKDMDRLFGPALSAPPIRAALDKFLPRADEGGASRVTLLPDVRLMGLPLELLSAFRSRGARPVARDFSIHVLAHRRLEYVRDHPAPPPQPAVLAVPALFLPTCHLASPYHHHRHRLRYANAVSDDPKAKGGPVPGAPTEIASADMCMVIDPRNEDTGSTAKENPRPTVMEAMDSLVSQVAPINAGSWTGVKGSERIPSVGEWQTMLRQRKNGGFLFYGPGRLLSHLPPDRLVGLDARGCRLVMLVDQADNDMSFRRQSKVNSTRRAAALALERPVEAAALWTLAGAGGVVVNQWASSFHANRRLVTRFFGAMGGTSGDAGPMQVGDALSFALSATSPEPVPGAEDAAADGGKRPGSAGSKGSKKGGKGKGGKSPKSSPSNSRPGSASTPDAPKLSLKARVALNPVLYGVPTMVLK